MIEQIVEAIRAETDQYAKRLPPDGDWSPMMFVVKDGGITVQDFPMPPNGQMRDFLFETVLPNQIRPQEPDAVVFLVSAWMSPPTDEEGMKKIEAGESPRPSEHPDRKEVVLIQGTSRDGEEFGVSGEIIRSEGHPELDWDIFPDANNFGGRMMMALRRGVWE